MKKNPRTVPLTTGRLVVTNVLKIIGFIDVLVLFSVQSAIGAIVTTRPFPCVRKITSISEKIAEGSRLRLVWRVLFRIKDNCSRMCRIQFKEINNYSHLCNILL